MKETLARLVPERRQEVQEFRKQHGDTKIGEVTVGMVHTSFCLLLYQIRDSYRFVLLFLYFILNNYLSMFQAYGGMRGIKGMTCETSVLDPVEVCFAAAKCYLIKLEK